MSAAVLTMILLSYLAVLFGVAWWGDRRASAWPWLKPWTYALSLAVYCTTWTFFGAVGTASASGWQFLPIYLGPVLVLTLGIGLLRRIVTLSRAENLTSIADFLAARYGKHTGVGALASAICLCAVVPYIALQLRAVEAGFDVLAPQGGASVLSSPLVIAVVMTIFALLFGTRHLSSSEQHAGMVQAIALESLVKMAALVAVAIYCLTSVLGGWEGFVSTLTAPESPLALDRQAHSGTLAFAVQTMLAAFAVLCLPRQFHVTVVECTNVHHLQHARWVFSIYLVILTVCVLPIALAGFNVLGTQANPDTYVLVLPMAGNQDMLAALAYVGGVSAATGMVIVSTVAVSIMISNQWVLPWLLNSRFVDHGGGERLDGLLRLQRRLTVVGVMVLALGFQQLSGGVDRLANLGLLSFVAVAQLAPALVLGLFWRTATAVGALAGMAGGFFMWAWLLVWPLTSGRAPASSLVGLSIDTMTMGAMVSLIVNFGLFAVVSSITEPSIVEHSQARKFLGAGADETDPDMEHPALRIRDLRFLLKRFLGSRDVHGVVTSLTAGATDSAKVTQKQLHAAEIALRGVLGSSAAQLVIARAGQHAELSIEDVAQIVDDAAGELQYSSSLLRATLENVSQGISVIDRDLQLAAWNQRYLDLFEYPKDLIYQGVPIASLIAYNASRGLCGPGSVDFHVERRMNHLRAATEYRIERSWPDGSAIELIGRPLPGGGFVTTYSDITEHRNAQRELATTNERLEETVAERTRALQQAKADAERANKTKTQYLAAASHDLLQPINAARLFAAGWLDKENDLTSRDAARRIDAALGAAETVITDLSEINRLNAKRVPVRREAFPIENVLGPLVLEFGLLAEQRGLELHDVRSSCCVQSDSHLLRRIIQNFLSNALRYCPTGQVLIGCRRQPGVLRIIVADSGPGVPLARQDEIFEEFARLPGKDAEAGKGSGLGLAIVKRTAALLGHPIGLRSIVGRGSMFWVDVPRANPNSVTADAPARPQPRDWPAFSGRTVLCIDNDPHVLEGLRLVLENWQLVVMTAANREQARSACPSAPDVALIDFQLDEELGTDVLTALRATWGADVPAVLITADRSDTVREAAAATGCILLHKPVKPAALRAALSRAAVVTAASARQDC